MTVKSAVQPAASRCGGGVLVCTSLASVGLFVYTALTLARYTPLYTPLECLDQKGEIGDIKMNAEWLNTTGAMRKRCKNPNGYDVVVLQRSVGRVFVLEGNSTLLPIGWSFVADTSLPAKGGAEGSSRMEIAVPMSEAAPLLSQPLLRVVSEIHIRSEVALSFFGIPLRSGEDKDEVCGFELKLATKKLGPTACARTLAELVIPDVDSAPRPRQVQMDRESLEAQARKKNLAFGLLMALFGTTALVSFLLSLRLCCSLRQARAAQAKAKAKLEVVVQV